MMALSLSFRMTCLRVGTVSSCHENFFRIYVNKDETGASNDRSRDVLWPQSAHLQDRYRRKARGRRRGRLEKFLPSKNKMILLLTRENSTYDSGAKTFWFNLDKQLANNVKHLRFQTFSFRPSTVTDYIGL